MKKIILLISIIFMFSIPAYAKDSCSRDILDNISAINGGWHPIVGNSVYHVKYDKVDLQIIRLYDSFANNDPEQATIQVIFIKKANKCQIISIIFSSVDLSEHTVSLTNFINILN